MDKNEYERDLRRVRQRGLVGQLVAVDFAQNPLYVRSHLGGGNLFADCLRHKARYVPERKLWFVHNGKFWEPDLGSLHTMELCKSLAEALAQAAVGLLSGEESARWFAYAEKWQNRKFRETVLRDAQGIYPARLADFDRQPYLFNCQNGTLDVRTGAFHRHDPSDMLATISGVDFDPDARSALWEKTVSEAMQGDQDLSAYLQKALGYGLTGDTSEECFFLLYGPTTRNGKGTVMETYMKMLGAYGRAARPETIALRQNYNASGPSEEIAKLAGARAVNISEPDKQMVLSAALVKTLTGNDTMTARFLNENSFEFRPQFKLFINTNHLPKANDVTIFSSGRVKVLPFNRHFADSEQDKTLKKRLEGELPGVLNWCLEGLRLMQGTGFAPPPAVLDATARYRRDSDKIARFVEEVLVADPQGEVRMTALYAAYKDWCRGNGLLAESLPHFRQGLGALGEIKTKRPQGASRESHRLSMLCGFRLGE